MPTTKNKAIQEKKSSSFEIDFKNAKYFSIDTKYANGNKIPIFFKEEYGTNAENLIFIHVETGGFLRSSKMNEHKGEENGSFLCLTNTFESIKAEARQLPNQDKIFLPSIKYIQGKKHANETRHNFIYIEKSNIPLLSHEIRKIAEQYFSYFPKKKNLLLVKKIDSLWKYNDFGYFEDVLQAKHNKNNSKNNDNYVVSTQLSFNDDYMFCSDDLTPSFLASLSFEYKISYTQTQNKDNSVIPYEYGNILYRSNNNKIDFTVSKNDESKYFKEINKINESILLLSLYSHIKEYIRFHLVQKEFDEDIFYLKASPVHKSSLRKKKENFLNRVFFNKSFFDETKNTLLENVRIEAEIIHSIFSQQNILSHIKNNVFEKSPCIAGFKNKLLHNIVANHIYNIAPSSTTNAHFNNPTFIRNDFMPNILDTEEKYRWAEGGGRVPENIYLATDYTKASFMEMDSERLKAYMTKNGEYKPYNMLYLRRNFGQSETPEEEMVNNGLSYLMINNAEELVMALRLQAKDIFAKKTSDFSQGSLLDSSFGLIFSDTFNINAHELKSILEKEQIEDLYGFCMFDSNQKINNLYFVYNNNKTTDVFIDDKEVLSLEKEENKIFTKNNNCIIFVPDMHSQDFDFIKTLENQEQTINDYDNIKKLFDFYLKQNNSIAKNDEKFKKEMFFKYCQNHSFFLESFIEMFYIKSKDKSSLLKRMGRLPKDDRFLFASVGDISYYNQVFPDIINYGSNLKFSAKTILENPVYKNYYMAFPYFRKILLGFESETNKNNQKYPEIFDFEANANEDKYIQQEITQEYEKLGIMKFAGYPLIFSLETPSSIKTFIEVWTKMISKDTEEYKEGSENYKKIKKMLDESLKNKTKPAFLIKKNIQKFNTQENKIYSHDILVLVDEFLNEITRIPIKNVLKFYDEAIKANIFTPRKAFKKPLYTKNGINKVIQAITVFNKEVFDREREEGYNKIIRKMLKDGHEIKEIKNFFMKFSKELEKPKKATENEESLYDSFIGSITMDILEKDNFIKSNISNYGLEKARFKDLQPLLRGIASYFLYRNILSIEEKYSDKSSSEYLKRYIFIIKDFLRITFGLLPHQVDETYNFLALNLKNKDKSKTTNNIFWEMRTGKTRLYLSLAILLGTIKNKNSLMFLQNKNIHDILIQAQNMHPGIVEKYIDVVGDPVGNIAENSNLDKIFYKSPIFSSNLFPNIPNKISKFLKNPLKNTAKSPKEILTENYIIFFSSMMNKIQEDESILKHPAYSDKTNPFFSVLKGEKHLSLESKHKPKWEINILLLRKTSYYYLNMLLTKGFIRKKDCKQIKEIVNKEIENIRQEYFRRTKNYQGESKSRVIFVGKNALSNYAAQLKTQKILKIEKEEDTILDKISIPKIITDNDVTIDTKSSLHKEIKIPREDEKEIEQGANEEDEVEEEDETRSIFQSEMENFLRTIVVPSEITEMENTIFAPNFLTIMENKKIKLTDNSLAELYSGFSKEESKNISLFLNSFFQEDNIKQIFDTNNIKYSDDELSFYSNNAKNIVNLLGQIFTPYKINGIFEILDRENTKEQITNIPWVFKTKMLETILIDKKYPLEIRTIGTNNTKWASLLNEFEVLKKQIIDRFIKTDANSSKNIVMIMKELSHHFLSFFDEQHFSKDVNRHYYNKLVKNFYFKIDGMGNGRKLMKLTGNIPTRKIFQTIKDSTSIEINLEFKNNSFLHIPSRFKKQEAPYSDILPITQIAFKQTTFDPYNFNGVDESVFAKKIIFELKSKNTTLGIRIKEFVNKENETIETEYRQTMTPLNSSIFFRMDKKDCNSICAVVADEIHKNISSGSVGFSSKIFLKDIQQNNSQNEITNILGTGTAFTGTEKFSKLVELSNIREDNNNLLFKNFTKNLYEYCTEKIFTHPIIAILYINLKNNARVQGWIKDTILSAYDSLEPLYSSGASQDMEILEYKLSILLGEDIKNLLNILYAKDIGSTNKLIIDAIKKIQKNKISSFFEDKKIIFSVLNSFFAKEIKNKKILALKDEKKQRSEISSVTNNILNNFENLATNKMFTKIAHGNIANILSFIQIIEKMGNKTNTSIARSSDNVKYNILDDFSKKEKNIKLPSPIHGKEKKLLAVELLLSKYRSLFFLRDINMDFINLLALTKKIIKNNLRKFGLKSISDYNGIFNRSNKTVEDSIEDYYQQYLMGKSVENIDFSSEIKKQWLHQTIDIIDMFFENNNFSKFKKTAHKAVEEGRENISTIFNIKNQKETRIKIPAIDVASLSFSYQSHFGESSLRLKEETIGNTGTTPGMVNRLPDFYLEVKKGKPFITDTKSKTESPVFFAKEILYDINFSESKEPNIFPTLKFVFNLKNSKEEEITEMIAYTSYTRQMLIDEINKGKNTRVMSTRQILTQSSLCTVIDCAINREDTSKPFYVVANITTPSLKTEVLDKINKKHLEDKYQIYIIETNSIDINNVFESLREDIDNKNALVSIVGNGDALAEGQDMGFVDVGCYYGAPSQKTPFIQSLARQIGAGKEHSDVLIYNGGSLGKYNLGGGAPQNSSIKSDLFHFLDQNTVLAFSNTSSLKELPKFLEDERYLKVVESFIINNNKILLNYLNGYIAYMSGNVSTFLEETNSSKNYFSKYNEELVSFLEENKLLSQDYIQLEEEGPEEEEGEKFTNKQGQRNGI